MTEPTRMQGAEGAALVFDIETARAARMRVCVADLPRLLTTLGGFASTNARALDALLDAVADEELAAPLRRLRAALDQAGHDIEAYAASWGLSARAPGKASRRPDAASPDSPSEAAPSEGSTPEESIKGAKPVGDAAPPSDLGGAPASATVVALAARRRVSSPIASSPGGGDAA